MATQSQRWDGFDKLPGGWEVRFDARLGRYYFIDHVSKKTTWEDPRLKTTPPPPPHPDTLPPELKPAQDNLLSQHQNVPKPSTQQAWSSNNDAHNTTTTTTTTDEPGLLEYAIEQQQFAIAKISAMFPTVPETHIKELMMKYHNREAVVISALQVQKHPLATPGPYGTFTPPPMRHFIPTATALMAFQSNKTSTVSTTQDHKTTTTTSITTTTEDKNLTTSTTTTINGRTGNTIFDTPVLKSETITLEIKSENKTENRSDNLPSRPDHARIIQGRTSLSQRGSLDKSGSPYKPRGSLDKSASPHRGRGSLERPLGSPNRGRGSLERTIGSPKQTQSPRRTHGSLERACGSPRTRGSVERSVGSPFLGRDSPLLSSRASSPHTQISDFTRSLMGSPRMDYRYSPRPTPHSPKIKLRYLKGIFPKVEPTIILDILTQCNYNVKDTSEKLLEMGHEKKETNLAPPRLKDRPEGKENKDVTPKPSPGPARPKNLSEKNKKKVRNQLTVDYPALTPTVVTMALQSVYYDEGRARQVLDNMAETDKRTQHALATSIPHISKHNESKSVTLNVSPPICRRDGVKPTRPTLPRTRINTAWTHAQTVSRGTSTEEDIGFRSDVRSRPHGPNTKLHKGPSEYLLLSDYQAWHGPNPDNATGHSNSLAQGPKRTLLRGPSGRARGQDPTMRKGPQGLAKGPQFTQELRDYELTRRSSQLRHLPDRSSL